MATKSVQSDSGVQAKDVEREMRQYVDFHQEEIKILTRYLIDVENQLLALDGAKVPESKRKAYPEQPKIPKRWQLDQNGPKKELQVYVTEKIFEQKVRTEPKLTGQFDVFISLFDSVNTQTQVIDLNTGQVCYCVNQNAKLYAANSEMFLLDHEIITQVDGKWEQICILEKISIACALFIDAYLLVGLYDTPKMAIYDLKKLKSPTLLHTSLIMHLFNPNKSHGVAYLQANIRNPSFFFAALRGNIFKFDIDACLDYIATKPQPESTYPSERLWTSNIPIFDFKHIDDVHLAMITANKQFTVFDQYSYQALYQIKLTGDLPRIVLCEHFDSENRPLLVNQIDEPNGGKVVVMHLGNESVTMLESAKCESKIVGQSVRNNGREVVAINAKGQIIKVQIKIHETLQQKTSSS
ncbi:hypothetical protein FGO68_gene7369 [Halteria grandinella]|uniref:Uncharacterized protein n=1 Tax=Halteria grandinella TaxID=5974 RepID=A0A8J8T3Z7_HALGN|nr:hypothetical protein FGO68_gene7369 [Halteria grandinella]